MKIPYSGNIIPTEKTKIDFVMILVVFVILTITVGIAIFGVIIFRQHYPNLSADSLWDESIALPVFAATNYIVKKIIVVKKRFNVLITDQYCQTTPLRLHLTRRKHYLLSLRRPSLLLEDNIVIVPHLVRNIHWWGIRWVDHCLLVLATDDSFGIATQLKIDLSMMQNNDTWKL